MMALPTVSVLLPLAADAGADAASVTEEIKKYLESTGFTFEILTPNGPSYGASLRRGAAEATGSIVVVVDVDLPYRVAAIGDAVAMIESLATDVVFATSRPNYRGGMLLRSMLVPIIPDLSMRLKAFSAAAAKLILSETKLNDINCDLEVAFLANKYGYRVERLNVERRTQEQRLGRLRLLAGAFRIRMTNRRMGYRAARRCPVCFSSEVWTCAQIPFNVVRACRRCKCRYLNQFTDDDEALPVRRVLRAPVPAQDVTEESDSRTARDKTSARRLAEVRKQLPPRARILEIGVREGSFGVFASREFEYVGIDPSAAVVRGARSRELEVYCATLSNFVNTGPAFDGINLAHVFENLVDPHDALVRLKDLLKPGGALFLTTFDTEGLLYLLTERKRMTQNFRTHLILYSRSALIELLEHSGFEIDAIAPDFEYRDHRFLRHVVGNRWPAFAPLVRGILKIIPDPILVGSGSIRIIAKRRAGSPLNVRAISSVEPTHAR